MTRRMLRYEVMASDRPQTLLIGGEPVHVAAGRLGVGPNAQHLVEFWTEGDVDGGWAKHTFQVFGTGHPLPDDAVWCGTTDRTPEGLVWHLFELTRETP